MKKDNKAIIKVLGTEIAVISGREFDFISLSDMVKNFEGGSALIEQWLRNKDTVKFLGIWERINNPQFNSPEFTFEGNKHNSMSDHE